MTRNVHNAKRRCKPQKSGTAHQRLDGCSFALLLYGEVFRAPVPSTWGSKEAARGAAGARHGRCHASVVQPQREATESYVERIIKPLEAWGATTEVLFTFTKCPRDAASTHRLRTNMTHWLGGWEQRVTGYWDITSRHGMEAIQKAYLLLAQRLHARGDWFDYVLQAKHDIYQQLPISAWPGTTVITTHPGHTLTGSTFGHMSTTRLPYVDFEKVLLEAPCAQCSSGCSCGLGKPLRADCRLCNNDHMVWTPRRWLPAVMGAGLGGHFEHVYMRKLLVPDDAIGWIYPPVCTADFCVDIISNEFKAYRPRRDACPDGSCA